MPKYYRLTGKPREQARAWWDEHQRVHQNLLAFCKKIPGTLPGYAYYNSGKWGPRAEHPPAERHWTWDKKSDGSWLPNTKYKAGRELQKQMAGPDYQLPSGSDLVGKLGLQPFYVAGGSFRMLSPGLAVLEGRVILALPDEAEQPTKKPGFTRISDLVGEACFAEKKKPKKTKAG